MSIQKAYESYGNNLIGAGGGGGSFSQIQSDWDVSDNARVDYIKNKPDVPSDAGDLDYDNTSSGLSANDVQGAIDELAKPTPKVIYDMGAWKNGLGNRGKDITSYLTDGTLWKRIAGTDGFEPFEDIFLGDIIDLGTAITAPNSDVTGDSKVVVLEFDPCTAEQLMTQFYHHIVVCPLTHFGTGIMNDTNTTVGGYTGSKMQTDILGYDVTTAGTISTQLYNILGTHLKKIKSYLTSGNIIEDGYNRTGSNSGCSDGTSGFNLYAQLMSEIEVYGSIIWSSSGRDTGSAFKQFSAFRNNKRLITQDNIYYWLKDIVSKYDFSCCTNVNGNMQANHRSATTKRHVRPCFILG